jgi:hypothetical protein
MTPKNLRGGSSMSPRAGNRRGGRLTQNSPSENPNGRSIKNGDIVDGNLTTSEEIRRQQPRSMW